ncbi:hypothetical protein Bca4012_043275 [Brassica carinata]|uniref:Uncharacterized protein n=1 Tax=Brassica carinata TaxID=52824 RepID=A0A8X7QYZ6_BRACI|nr:hypothetical protein Bca52824_059053 [Brassica carinata]
MNGVRDDINILANDLQVTLIIKNYNQNATSRLDVDLIITDLEVQILLSDNTMDRSLLVPSDQRTHNDAGHRLAQNKCL